MQYLSGSSLAPFNYNNQYYFHSFLLLFLCNTLWQCATLSRHAKEGKKGESFFSIWCRRNSTWIFLQLLTVVVVMIGFQHASKKVEYKGMSVSQFQFLRTVPLLVPNVIQQSVRVVTVCIISYMAVYRQIVKISNTVCVIAKQVDDTEVISFLLQTEIIPLCLRTMEMGSELSKTVSDIILRFCAISCHPLCVQLHMESLLLEVYSTLGSCFIVIGAQCLTVWS